MRGKMARSAAHPPFPTVHVAAAVRATACLARTPENRKNSHWFGGSYGESRLIAFPPQRNLSSEPKCNTPADLIIGTVDQDLRECCHAMLFAFVG